MLVLGGKDNAISGYSDRVWKLTNGFGWRLTNNLQQAMGRGSAILFENSIYSFGGLNNDLQFPIQRLDMATDGTIEQIELIGAHDDYEPFPILLITDANTCVTH